MIKAVTFLFSIAISLPNAISAEPFVVLSYQNSGEFEGRDNEFTRDPDFSTKHRILSGESLNEIINRYYGDSGLNKYFLQLSIVTLNSDAFRNRNPNYMIAEKTIHLPSVNQITNLMKGIEFELDVEPSERTNKIYFFGG